MEAAQARSPRDEAKSIPPRRLTIRVAAPIAAILWIALNGAVLLLANGRLPFDRPALAGIPFAVQVAAPSLTMVQIFLLMGVVYWLTRKRVIPDLAARAPARRIAGRETVAVLAYAAAGQVGGWIVGPALGFRPFSFHIAGTLFGCSTPPLAGRSPDLGDLQFRGFRRRALSLVSPPLRPGRAQPPLDQPAQRSVGHRRRLSHRERVRVRSPWTPTSFASALASF